MGDSAQVAKNESHEPRFDVHVRKPEWVDVALVRQQALVRRLMPEDKLNKFLHALQVQARVQVGSSVTQDWAQRVRASFVAVGLEVDVTRVLSLEQVVAATKDPREECPACGELVLLSPERQCPACTVFVDKVSEAQRLRRRALKRRGVTQLDSEAAARQAEAALEAEFEAVLRKRIREEIEAELAQKKALEEATYRHRRAVVMGVVGVLMVLVFGIGHWSGALATRDVLTAQAATLSAAGGESPAPLLGLIGQAPLPKTTASTPEAGPMPFVPAQDSLVASLEQHKKQGQALSIEQAIALAQQAASGDQGARVGFGSGSVARQALGLQTQGLGGVAVPVQQKIEMQAEFVRLLADNGQPQQAAELLKVLGAQPVYTSDAQAQALLAQMQWEQRSWDVVHAPAGDQPRLIQALGAQLAVMADVAQRTQALRSTAVILAHAPGLLPYASRFFALADAAMGGLADAGQKQQAQQAKLLATGRIAVLQVDDKAKSGLWSQAQGLAGQFAALLPPEPQAMDVRWAALDWQCKMTAGLRAEAATRLAQVLDHLDQEADVPQRARLLRLLAQGRNLWGDERFQRSLTQLGTDAATQAGLTQAQTWAQVALMLADAGQMDQFAAYSKQALAASLKPEERVQVQADLLVYGEMVTVHRLSRMRAYFEAKPHISTVTAYLF